ncbi:hypothetical protein [Emticicia sp. BO119]|uniref:hypothetical protein n=1 Tax=Emticicia sp. BO119 TaxID=2757768 RepID=UPI0015F04854|nr:hypothetical protein [Emticicia sp. BO119]MBA4851426.1 hypothetical protein [Emticicia sp. BO119]
MKALILTLILFLPIIVYSKEKAPDTKQTPSIDTHKSYFNTPSLNSVNDSLLFQGLIFSNKIISNDSILLTILKNAPLSISASDNIFRENYKSVIISSLAYNKAKFDYYSNGYTHQSKIFSFQLFSSQIIFWLVVAIVISGLIMSGLQFYNSFKSVKLHKEEMEEESQDYIREIEKKLHSNLEISLKGMRVKNSIIGILILSISLAFFYLYMVYIYAM